MTRYLKTLTAAKPLPLIRPLVTCALLLGSGGIHALDWRGNISSELTWFPDSSTGTDNWQFNTSLAAEAELTHDLNDSVRLTISPYMRVDQNDDERTRAGLRELLLSVSGDTWEINAGLGTVFWGVTESRNPVDIINQTDGVDAIAGDEKLGQAMLNYNWFSDYGDFSFFLMPKFHEQTFPGPDGRPFGGISVDPDLTTYESSQGNSRTDFALRWIYSFDAWDVGLHYFDGTSRNPTLAPAINGTTVSLAPRYSLIRQTGIDAQGLYGDLSLKAEVIHINSDEIETHSELVTGLEYTLVGFLSGLQENEKLPEEWCTPETRNPLKKLVCNDRIDLGLVLEYLWDERGDTATHPFQSDVLAGFRFAFNDAASSDALIGFIQDVDGGATSLSVEASTRLFESYRLKILGRQFLNTSKDTLLSGFKDESYLQFDLSYFF